MIWVGVRPMNSAFQAAQSYQHLSRGLPSQSLQLIIVEGAGSMTWKLNNYICPRCGGLVKWLVTHTGFVAVDAASTSDKQIKHKCEPSHPQHYKQVKSNVKTKQ